MENSKRKIRIGDRFEWDKVSVWEVKKFTQPFKVNLVCVYSPNAHATGSKVTDYGIVGLLDDTHPKWTYLGNYNKVNLFEQLYNLLNS